jgi:ketosteroid isomerase-like protein
VATARSDPGLHSITVTKTEEANRPITLRWYDEWNSEGLPGFERVWAPDIVLHEAREFPETGVFRGTRALADRI